MHIAVLGGNGKAGSQIIQEAQRRGVSVTAIVRNKEKLLLSVPAIEKDVYALTKQDIKDVDVLVCALGFRQDVSEFSRSMSHLITILTGEKTRLLVVGGGR